MGCEKFRDGALGVGGVRASMERRWLINAKTTVMRQRKWQEVREQKEQEQMKKVAEILEKRKRERARLAAYIHMQPAKCAANASKISRTENKRSNWNSFLMEDQEIIMKFRERSAGAHNNQKANLASDNLWQGSEKFEPCGAYTNSYIKGYHAPDQNFVMCNRYMENNTYESFNNPEKYHTDTDQRSEVSAAKCSIKSEPVRHTTWSLEASTYVSVAEEARRQPVAKTKRLGGNPHEEENDPHMAIQSENAIHAPQKKSKHLAISKLAESYAEAYSAASNSTTPREDETTSAQPRCDLRQEILKARQANEAATARLMAEVNAIESRLEDCNLSLKPLDFREAETDGVTNELNRFTSDTDPLYCDSPGETDSNLSSESDGVTSGPSKTLSKRTAEGNNYSHGKSHRKQVIMETAADAAADPQPPSDIDWNTVTVSSPETCHEMNMSNTETKSMDEVKAKPYEDPRSLSTLRRDYKSQSPKPSSDINWNIDTGGSPESDMEPHGFQATREAYTYQKYVNEGNSAAMSKEKLETNARTSKDSSLVWDIDWDTPKERFPQKKMDYSQSNQQVSPSRMSARGDRKFPTKQNSIQQELTEDTRSLREERRRFESCHRRPPTIPDGGGNMFRMKVDMLPLPLHHLNFGFSQPKCRPHIQTEFLHPTYPLENNAIDAPSGPTRTIDTIGDKENYRRIRSGAVTEEEEKIFASLERLDWKLAALQSRSVSSGRDSFASQGEFSTKSAPAVMGPPIKKLGLAGLHCAKNPIPYSTVPARPLTPQSHRPPTGLRRRRQVGLTNMCAGKPSHCCPKYPTGTSKGTSDVGSGKCLSSGKIVCHQNALELFDAAAAC